MYLVCVILIVVVQSVENVVKSLQTQRKGTLFSFRKYLTWASKFGAGQLHFIYLFIYLNFWILRRFFESVYQKTLK
jgi:hypothetical protein